MFDHPDQQISHFVDANEEKRVRWHSRLIVAVFTVVVALVAAIGANASYQAATHGTDILKEISNVPVIGDVSRFVFGNAETTPGTQSADRQNFLFLGVGGEGHEGPQLTDSMMLVAITLKEKRVAIMNIPRDLAYPLGDGKFEKINAVNAYAEQDHPGQGASLTAEAVGKLFNIQIDHVLRIDFNGFAALIDAIGGIDIDVEPGFTDPQYPKKEDDTWTTVTFKKGLQHMDGATALVFVRSRHGSNGEGSDFARSRRQQQVSLAMKNKLMSLGTLSDPRKLANIYNAIAAHVQTDLTPWDILKLAPLAPEVSLDKIQMHVLSDAENGKLAAANVNGSYMLFPKVPDWSELRDLAQNPFATDTQALKPTTDLVKLEIKNGTTRTGFAAQVAASLEKQGYDIVAFGNAVRRQYERSVIFDLTGGKKSRELADLRKILDASVSMTPPAWLATTGTSARVVYGDGLAPERITSPNTDFLVILGEASYGLLNK